MELREAFNNYVSSVPIVKEGLSEGASDEEIGTLLDGIGRNNTEEIAELLKFANGEKEENNTGVIAGLYLLSSKQILSEYAYFKECGIEFTSIGTDAIMEEDNLDRKWIPFAYDCGRCFFAIDLSPAKSGKVGQIITIDLDYDQCYLLADSLCDMFEKFTKWYKEGILVINEEDGEKYLSGKNGHFFDSLDELLVSTSVDGSLAEIADDYWKTQYSKKLTVTDGKTFIDKGILSGEKKLYIKGKDLSLDIVRYMNNLKEVILHDCKIRDISGLANAPEITKIIFANCELVNCSLDELASSPKLKELSLNVMSGKGLEQLSGIKTLKEVSIREVKDIDAKSLAVFVNLQKLNIEKMNITDAGFVSNMKGLKILNLKSEELDNLDFLPSLTKLSEFTLQRKAKDEKGLLAINNLTKLGSFIYPVTDINVYKDCKSLTSVGFAPEVKNLDNFEVFEGSNVTSFTVCGTTDKNDAEVIFTKIGKYTKICSYGSIG